VLARCTALFLRCARMRHPLIVIALFMLGGGLKMVVGRSDMACGGEMVLVASQFILGVGHDLFLRVEVNASIDASGSRN
jgi:hypothetical protein